MTPQCTVVIAVYEKARELQFVLAALDRQSFTAFDVIVADDGSGGDVAAVVNAAKRSYRYPIRHLWHADRGWRKNLMLNYAIRESTTEYLIFIDGDCIPSRRFVEDHWMHRAPGRILLGRRVEHGPRWARHLTMEKIRSGSYERYSLSDIADAVAGRSRRLEHGIRIPFRLIRRLTESSGGILGSNMSTFKEHLVAVNGFDVEYTGPGTGEDTDLLFRLGLIGVTGTSLRNLAVQYHCWHPLTKTSEANERRFASVRAAAAARCKNGLNALN
jgi:glycosyltransferase involved in cell wall biosynthesis